VGHEGHVGGGGARGAAQKRRLVRYS
jgi:hypothetical protein